MNDHVALASGFEALVVAHPRRDGLIERRRGYLLLAVFALYTGALLQPWGCVLAQQTQRQYGKARPTTRTRTSIVGILSWIVMGLIVGVLAKFIMPGRDPGGLVITVALGIGGAFVGGYIGSFLGIGTVSGFNVPSIFIATLGAIVLLALYRALKR